MMRVQGQLCGLLLLWVTQAQPGDFCMLDRDSARIQTRPAPGVEAVSCRTATLQLEFNQCTRSSSSIELQVRCMLQLSRSERVVVVADTRPLWMDQFTAQQHVSWVSGKSLLAIKTACTGADSPTYGFYCFYCSASDYASRPRTLYLCLWLLCLCLCLTVSGFYSSASVWNVMRAGAVESSSVRREQRI